MAKPKISVLVPVYNEQDNVKPLYQKVLANLKKVASEYEIVFVNDGSTDKTLANLKAIANKDSNVSIISFYRNFGKANALAAGFKNVKGDIVFTMDGDLQDDPDEFINFIKELDKGYDLVSGWKFHRKDPLGKRLPSKVFNFLIKEMTGCKVHDSNCGFKAYRREVLENLDVYGEFHRYIPILAEWRGFRVGEIKVKHHKRASGSSKYGLERLYKGFLDLITVTYLTQYGRSPMYLFASMSMLSGALGFMALIWSFLDVLIFKTPFARNFIVICVVLFMFALNFFAFGLLAEKMLATAGPERMTKSFYKVYMGK